MDRTNILDGSSKWPKQFGKISGMAEPALSDDDLRELRQRYNAAYSAYQTCVIAINAAAITGQPPSPELLEKEAAALRELTDARAKLEADLRAEEAALYELAKSGERSWTPSRTCTGDLAARSNPSAYGSANFLCRQSALSNAVRDVFRSASAFSSPLNIESAGHSPLLLASASSCTQCM